MPDRENALHLVRESLALLRAYPILEWAAPGTIARLPSITFRVEPDITAVGKHINNILAPIRCSIRAYWPLRGTWVETDNVWLQVPAEYLPLIRVLSVTQVEDFFR